MALFHVAATVNIPVILLVEGETEDAVHQAVIDGTANIVDEGDADKGDAYYTVSRVDEVVD